MNEINSDRKITKEMVKEHANELCRELIETNSISLCTISVMENGKFNVVAHQYLTSKDLDDCINILIKNRIEILQTVKPVENNS